MNGWRQARGRDVSEDIGDIDGVLRSLLTAPVRLVHLLFDNGVLEGAVRKRIYRVEVHVVLGKEALETGARGAVVHERFGRGRRETQRETKRLVRRHSFLHLRHIGAQAVRHQLPVIGGMNESRVTQMSKATEIHTFSTLPVDAERTMASVTATPWIISSVGIG